MAGDGCDRDRGRDTDEDQKRRHQKPAADAEHAGHEAHGRAHRKDEEHIDRKVGDRKVELHARFASDFSPEAGRNRSRHSFQISGVDHRPRLCITEIAGLRD